MRAAAIRRRPVARRVRPAPRPVLVRPKTARARSRWPAVLLALLIAALLWWRLHPAEKPAPTAPPVHAVAAAQVLPPVLHRKPAPAKRASRDILLAAVRERAASLRSCASRPGAPARLSARLHVARSGAMRSIDFPGAPPSKSVGDCVSEAAMRWDFSSLELPADLELLVTLSF
jgi:hypothetical protein